METLETEYGKMLKEIIIKRIPIRFILRSMGDIRKKDYCNIVIEPLTIVTWDACHDFKG